MTIRVLLELEETMGDDLIAARRFCVEADQHLAYLSSTSATPRQSFERLNQLEKSADHVKARAIAREVRQSRQALRLERAKPEDFRPWLDQTLYGLTFLIGQYRQGLCEITPQKTVLKETPAKDTNTQELFAQKNQASEISTPVLAPTEKVAEKQTARTVAEAVSVNEGTKTHTMEPMAAEYFSAHRAAQDVLRPLLQFVRNDRRYNALSKLAGFTADTVAKTTTEPATGLEAQLNIGDDIDFTALIPSLSNAALSAARRTGKIVSLSYDCDSVTIPQSARIEIEGFLVTIGSSLVEHVLEWPNVRQARGQSGAGHISLSARETRSGLELSFECPGTPIAATHFKENKLAGQSYNIDLTPENDGQRLTLKLSRKLGRALNAATLTEANPIYAASQRGLMEATQ